ncbi:MAG: hypothetical protein LBB23_03010 [Rickettsiales bacterium]|jgi:hypothetical protein|nr:hypothetical protein [Rickettsiales bacterium]
MIKDLQNIDGKISDIDLMPEETRLIIYKALHKEFKDSPLLVGNSFERKDGYYSIFNMNYEASQILVLSDLGQMTLDGNDKYYYCDSFKFDDDDQEYVSKNFASFREMGKKYGANIFNVIMVPVMYKEDDYTKLVGEVIPVRYNFAARMPNLCRALVVPLHSIKQPNGEVIEIPLNCGIMAGGLDSIKDFADAGPRASRHATARENFREAFCRMLERTLKGKAI